MILSVSRRTDIPAYYSEWFMNRLRAGFALTRNPMNRKQVSNVILAPCAIDGIVFWTKDPLKLMDHLDEIDQLGFAYYFQFTLTPYNRTIEKGLRDKAAIINTFQALSRRIGKERIIWRYDPIILNEHIKVKDHQDSFTRLCDQLWRYTDACIISFVDQYAKLKTPLIRPISHEEMIELTQMIASIAKDYQLPVSACCEAPFLYTYGLAQAHCIDRFRMERIYGHPITVNKDKNQREGCGCFESIDIGMYNSCPSGCIYCYANRNNKIIRENINQHDPNGALLMGTLQGDETIRIRQG
jgi:hypothetical protein